MESNKNIHTLKHRLRDKHLKNVCKLIHIGLFKILSQAILCSGKFTQDRLLRFMLLVSCASFMRNNFQDGVI